MNKFFEKQLLYDLFQAYFGTRKNKRNTINALAFEIDYEKKLFELYEELKSGKYEIGQSICFIIFKPVQREVFAADFRDRIIHHLIFNYISPIFEKLFIYDSYSCRKEKGTSLGIKRLNHFIRSCSQNYSRDCHILKIDIKGYFMSIDRNILYQKIKKTLLRYGKNANFDIAFVLGRIKKVAFHDPTNNCVIKGKRSNWKGLPKDKSLFFAGENKGLPIGNLISQLFGNVYLNDFDHFAKNRLGMKYYGRYVDDIVIIHQDRKYLKFTISLLEEYLKHNLLLGLHPKKVYLQHFSKGVKFLGTVIKPYRTYIQNHVKGNFYQKIRYWNNFIVKNQRVFLKEKIKIFLASMNSYLGIMKHYSTYNLRKKLLTQDLSRDFYKYVYAVNDYAKLSINDQL
jgi:hypothetical protein